MKQQYSSRDTNITCLTILLTMVLGTWQASGVGTGFPYQESFEPFAADTAIVNSGGVGAYGWQGTPATSSNAAEVVAEAPPAPPNGYPLPLATHTNVMQLLGNVSNVFDVAQTQNRTNVVIDVMVMAGQLPVAPPVPLGAQVAAYFNTNGHLVLRTAVYTNGFGQINGPTNAVNRQWTEITGITVGSNEWVRITITMDYLTTFNSISAPAFTDYFYMIQLNGTNVTSPLAYTNLPIDYNDPFLVDGVFPSSGGAGTENKWFLNSDSGYGDGSAANLPNNQWFSGIAFEGAGKVDDLVISGSVAPPLPPQSAYDLWIANYYPGCVPCRAAVTNLDNDAADNYAEFLAGTDPTVGSSVFEIRSIVSATASNYVTWLGSTNSGVFTPYSVHRSTNLLEGPGGWMLVASNIARSATGTNSWWDTSPPWPGAFYRPSLPTNAP